MLGGTRGERRSLSLRSALTNSGASARNKTDCAGARLCGLPKPSYLRANRHYLRNQPAHAATKGVFTSYAHDTISFEV